MFLKKKPTRSEERVAAWHTCGRRTWGRATADGRERISVVVLARIDPRATRMMRMEDLDFRPVWRVTNLLREVKRHELQMKILEKGDEKYGALSRDMLESKRVISCESRPPKTLSHSYRKD
jgi:hypothetical protein